MLKLHDTVIINKGEYAGYKAIILDIDYKGYRVMIKSPHAPANTLVFNEDDITIDPDTLHPIDQMKKDLIWNTNDSSKAEILYNILDTIKGKSIIDIMNMIHIETNDNTISIHFKKES